MQKPKPQGSWGGVAPPAGRARPRRRPPLPAGQRVAPHRHGWRRLLEVVHEGEPGTTTTVCRIPIDYDGHTEMTCEQVRDGVYRLDHRGLLSFWAEVELDDGPPMITPPREPAIETFASVYVHEDDPHFEAYAAAGYLLEGKSVGGYTMPPMCAVPRTALKAPWPTHKGVRKLGF